MNKIKEMEEEIEVAIERLVSELRTVQTGRATPSVLENVHIDAYGSKMHISHVASIGVEDNKTLRVSPYDKSLLKDLEQGINNANLGLSVASDSEGLRVIFPMLTTERRVQYVKLAKDRLEEARIKIKLVRENTKKEIEKGEKDGDYGEDERNKYLEAMQKLVEESNNRCEALFRAKEEDLTNLN